MAKTYFSRDYISVRIIFIAAVVILSNLAWSLILVSNGYNLSDIIKQNGMAQRLILGIMESTTLIELPFIIVWNSLKHKDKSSVHLNTVTILISILVSTLFSWAFCQFREDMFNQFLINFVTDLTISMLATTTFTILINKDMVNELMVEKEKILEEKTRLAEANAIAQTDAMNMRIDNHFFFNSFSVLASLIQEDPQKAEDFLLELTDTHRSIISLSSENSIQLSKELKLLDSYMRMQRYRFGDRCIKLEYGPDTEDYGEKHIIPLSILHLVENAIKHNSYSEKNPLTISITLEPGKDGVDYIIVTNNRQEKISKPASTRQGLENMRKKYVLVCGHPPIIEENEHFYKVKLPIMEQWKY